MEANLYLGSDKNKKMKIDYKQKKFFIFRNKNEYKQKIIKINPSLENYRNKLYVKILNKLNNVLSNKFKKKINKYVIKLGIKGVGIKAYKYKNFLILDYNQKHWFLIKIFNINVYVKKNFIFLYSPRKNEILRVSELIIKNKKFDYYKGKGFVHNSINKLQLKKNEKKNYS